MKINMAQLKDINPKMFTEQIKQFIKHKKKYKFAIGFSDDPYYGDKKGDYVVGGKRKASTKRFFSYATCYLIDGKRKFTVAVLPKNSDKALVDYIITFKKIIDELGVKIDVLCLDREFYTDAVMSYLLLENISFIIPVKVQGKEMKNLIKVRGSCCRDYTMNPKSEKQLLLNIAICVKYFKGIKDKN